jgi:valyl-tRNA synthetase
MLRKNLQQLNIDTQNTLLVSNSLFQQYQKKLEETILRTKDEEKDKDLHHDKTKNMTRETSQIIQSIKNMYIRCQTTTQNKNQLIQINKDATLYDQLYLNLDSIYGRIMDLQEMTTEFKLHGNEYDNSTAIDLREASGVYSASTNGVPATNNTGGGGGGNSVSGTSNRKQSKTQLSFNS